MYAPPAEKHGTSRRVATVLNVAQKANQQAMKTEYPIVLVEWADACGSAPGWLTLEEVEDEGETLVHSVGFLVPVGDPGAKENHVTLLQTYHEGDGISLFYIPCQMVRQMKVVTFGDSE
jgi:hypothetical protein